MSLSLASLSNIAAFAGWPATHHLVYAASGSVELRAIRLELTAMGKALPRNTLAWGALRHISDFAGESSSASLAQTAPGLLEMRLLRRAIAKNIHDRQLYYCHLEDSDDWLYDFSRCTICTRVDDEDDWDRALWERWVGEC